MTTCEICGEKVPPVPSFSFGGTADFIHRCKNQRCERYNLPLESKTDDRDALARKFAAVSPGVRENNNEATVMAAFKAGYDARDEEVQKWIDEGMAISAAYERLREALEKYADKDNWNDRTGSFAVSIKGDGVRDIFVGADYAQLALKNTGAE